MTNQIFNILQNKCFWTFFFNDSYNIKEQCTLSRMLKTMGATQRIVLGYTSNAERLTGKASCKNIMVWNIIQLNFCYVTIRALTKIRLVCLLRV